MGTSSDDVKKQQFPNFLQVDSVANGWYEELADKDKTDWKSIHMAFQLCWPRKKGAKNMNKEYKEEIRDLQLKMEDMGKKEKVAGRDVYMHMGWQDGDGNHTTSHHPVASLNCN